MSKHSPGEWKAVASQENIFPHVLIPSSWREAPDQLTINAGGWPLEVQDANARLIAAAPDLLAALIGLDEAFCSINEFSTKEDRHDARLKLIAARAAVVKATGAA